MITLTPRTTLWEAVAVLQLMQTLKDIPAFVCAGEIGDLWRCADLCSCGKEELSLAFADAYREVDNSDLPYVEVLAQASAWPSGDEIKPPKFCVEPSEGGGIVICPFAPKRELELPVNLWRALVRVLRTYNVPVSLMGARGQWLDAVAFTEGEILTEQPMAVKIKKIASADLVIGVPNEWLWAASGFTKTLIYLYPDNVPSRRWFQFSDNKFGRIVYSPLALDVPRILAGLVQLIPLVG